MRRAISSSDFAERKRVNYHNYLNMNFDVMSEYTVIPRAISISYKVNIVLREQTGLSYQIDQINHSNLLNNLLYYQ